MSGSMSGCGNLLTSVVGGRYACIGAIKSGSRAAPMFDPTEPFCCNLRQKRVVRCRNFHQTLAHFLPQPCSFRGNLKQVGPDMESIMPRRRDNAACTGCALEYPAGCSKRLSSSFVKRRSFGSGWFLVSGFKFDLGIVAIRNEQLET